jgi:hypothetical protein
MRDGGRRREGYRKRIFKPTNGFMIPAEAAPCAHGGIEKTPDCGAERGAYR